MKVDNKGRNSEDRLNRGSEAAERRCFGEYIIMKPVQVNLRRLLLLSFLLIFTVMMVIPAVAFAYSNTPIKSNVNIYVNGNIISAEREPVAINGRILSSARTTFSKLGARIDWYTDTGKVDIIKKNTTISMKIGSSRANVNGSYRTMDAPPILVRGTVMVPVRFVAETLGSEVKWDGRNRAVLVGKTDKEESISRSWDRTPVVVIDPGHGGRLPGAIYSGIKEKDLNLDIAKRLNTLLKEQGVKTYMTRYNDSDVGLYSRAALANRVNADLFVSVHNNAGSSRYSGSMVLYYPARGGFTGRDFAAIVQKELVKTLGTRNLGIYSRPNLAVLRKTRMPAVIAEIAYMTNSSDMKKLKTESFRQNAAEALKNGVIKALESK